MCERTIELLYGSWRVECPRYHMRMYVFCCQTMCPCYVRKDAQQEIIECIYGET